jgi:iron complex outermembrane receptor protein
MDPSAQPQGDRSCTPLPNCIGVQGQSLDGNILPFSPKHKAALNATYTWDMTDGSTIDLSGSYFWQDIAYSSVFNRSYTKIPSWDQVDARLSWTSSGGDITVIGFVRNLLDEIVYDSRGAGLREAGAVGTTVGAGRIVSPTECFTTPQTSPGFGAPPANSCYTIGETLRPPMTWGAELQLRF